MNARPARRRLADIVPIGSQHTVAHSRVTGEIRYRNALQAQGPGSEQVKTAIPGEVIDACGGFEEGNRRAACRRLPAGHLPGEGCGLSIVKTADQSAFEALGEEFIESIHGRLIFTL